MTDSQSEDAGGSAPRATDSRPAEDDATVVLVVLHGRTPSRSLLDSSASALRRDEPHHGGFSRGQRALDEVVEVGSGERGGALG